MRTIRRKIYVVVVMLVIAIAIGVAICLRESNFIVGAQKKTSLTAVVDYASRERGKVLFNKNCSTCHRVGKGWIVEGPRLETVGERLSDSTIKELLFYPYKTIASNNYLRNIFNQFNAAHPVF
jgi:hypothetical protein